MNTTNVRAQCAQRLLATAGRAAAMSAFVGLDGFVDEILHVVDKRESAEVYHAPAHHRQSGRPPGRRRRQKHQRRTGQPNHQTGRQRPDHGQRPGQLRAEGDLPRPAGLSESASCLPGSSPSAPRSTASPSRARPTRWNSRTAKSWWANTPRSRKSPGPTSRPASAATASPRNSARSDLVGFVNWTMLPYMSDVWEFDSAGDLPFA